MGGFEGCEIGLTSSFNPIVEEIPFWTQIDADFAKYLL